MDAKLNLYLETESGHKADLDAVARAAEAFVGAIREIAYVLDPGMELRVELVSGTESSLSLNSIVRIVKGGDVKDLTLAAIVTAVIWWFTSHALDYGFDKVMDFLTGEDHQVVHLSGADKQEIAERVAALLQGKVAQPQVQQVYRELERDPAIRGVGATTQHSKRPSDIVPRSEFGNRGGYSIELEEPTRRHRISTERIVVIRPVLQTGLRRWTFAFREGEFGASIRDQQGLARLLSGAVRMREGIELDVELETVEEKTGSVWVPTKRTITRIFGVYEAPAQQILRFPLQSEDADNSDHRSGAKHPGSKEPKPPSNKLKE
ncbi:MAG TPA: hypothetical protein VFW28_08170 [Micropepsaceae bacterium]|nr:hypothetical protein [Micropepsaceae bacterium]